MESIAELFRFLLLRKRWWLIPIILFIVLLGILGILVTQVAQSPFIYTLF